MIRLAEAADFVRVQSILAQLDRNFFRKNKAVMVSLDEAALTQARFDEWLAGTCSITQDRLAAVVAQHHGEVVGFMLLRLSDPPPAGLSRMFRPVKVMKIEEIVVEGDRRGQGFGTSLLDFAMKLAAEVRAERIAVGTIGNQARAVRFYRKYFRADVEEYMFSRHLSLTHR